MEKVFLELGYYDVHHMAVYVTKEYPLWIKAYDGKF
jgi:hypothetical protein